MVSKSVTNLLKAAKYIKLGGEPALPFEFLGGPKEEEAPPTEQAVTELWEEEPEEETKEARPLLKMKNEELLQLGMAAIEANKTEAVDAILKELYSRSSRKAAAVQAELEAAIMEGEPTLRMLPKEEKPKFEPNPAVKGEWGEGPERDILLASSVQNLLKAAEHIQKSNKTEQKSSENKIDKIVQFGESFLAVAR
jgi:hypothetical protein